MAINRLRALRRARHLKLQNVADHTDVSVKQAWKWENEESVPHASKMSRLADLLGVTGREVALMFYDPAEASRHIPKADELPILAELLGLTLQQVVDMFSGTTEKVG